MHFSFLALFTKIFERQNTRFLIFLLRILEYNCKVIIHFWDLNNVITNTISIYDLDLHLDSHPGAFVVF